MQEVPRLSGSRECTGLVISTKITSAGNIVGLKSHPVNCSWAGFAGRIQTQNQILLRANNKRDRVTQRVRTFPNCDGLTSPEGDYMVRTPNQFGSALLKTQIDGVKSDRLRTECAGKPDSYGSSPNACVNDLAKRLIPECFGFWDFLIRSAPRGNPRRHGIFGGTRARQKCDHEGSSEQRTSRGTSIIVDQIPLSHTQQYRLRLPFASMLWRKSSHVLGRTA
jgi:hypothetical protein